jgi:hypothetical protein
MQLRTRWLVAPLAIAMACGSTETTNGTTSSTTVNGTALQAASGTITGFGSVLVDGVEYDDAGATVSNDTDPANPKPATIGDLRIGQQVTVTFANGKIDHVSIVATLIGEIDAGSISGVDAGSTSTVANSFTVNGQLVVYTPSGDDATVFEGISDASKLADGQLVEVHGTLGSDQQVLATRIVVLPADGTVRVRVAGIVQNANASTFTLGHLTVNYASARLVPSGATIQNGEKVFVWSDQLPTGTAPDLTLAAKSVFVAPFAFANKPVRIGGMITAVAPVTGQALPNLTVDGFAVDASKAQLLDGSVQDLAVNSFVRVVGTVANGKVQAMTIRIIPAGARRAVLLVGQVSNYTSQASFAVRGTTVDASHATFTNGNASQLADGAFVVVRGHVSSTGVVADQVMFGTPPQGVPVRLVGVVSGYDAGAKTFTLLGIGMQLGASVTYSGGDVSALKDGALVEVAGTFDGTKLVVSAIRFIPTSTMPTASLTGTASNVVAPSGGANGSMMLGNATVTITPGTAMEGGPLANGQVVQATVQIDPSTGTLTAQAITVVPTSTMVQLMGPITGFTSVSNFTVDGQTVDASNAKITAMMGASTDLAVGKIVRVTGTLSNGVVVASAVYVAM